MNDLVPLFNKMARELMVDNLSGSANGKTTVDMKDQYKNITLQVISWVWLVGACAYALPYVCALLGEAPFNTFLGKEKPRKACCLCYEDCWPCTYVHCQLLVTHTLNKWWFGMCLNSGYRRVAPVGHRGHVHTLYP